MWYWIIAGSIFLILELLALLSFTSLKNKYVFFDFIHDCCADESIDDIGSIVYTIVAAIIAVLFPFVIVSIVGYSISRFILFVIEKCKGLK